MLAPNIMPYTCIEHSILLQLIGLPTDQQPSYFVEIIYIIARKISLATSIEPCFYIAFANLLVYVQNTCRSPLKPQWLIGNTN